MASPSRYGCSDYRIEMMLAGLRARLHKEDLSEEERRELEEKIRELEDDFYA